MMFRMALTTLIVIVALPLALTAQDEEKVVTAKLSEQWDAMQARIRKSRRDLANLQIQYNGAANADTKKRIEESFATVRTTIISAAKSFMSEVDSFLAKNPKNIEIRKKRLEDTLFDTLDPTIRANDAEVLFNLTGDGQYIHRAAEFYDKAYDYDNAAKYWARAAEKAATLTVMEKLGQAYMNSFQFKRAKVAFSRARDLSSAERARKSAEFNVKVAQQYVDGWKLEKDLRDSGDARNLPRAEIKTTRGTIVIELYEDAAPNTVANFVSLIDRGFFNGQLFHRNIAYFMIQGGCPEGTGQGGPGYRIKDEYGLPTARLHYPGVLSMANTNQPNTNGSQFFVTSGMTANLNGRHTVFARVLSGIEVTQVTPLDATNKSEPFGIISVTMIRKRNHDYAVEKIQ